MATHLRENLKKNVPWGKRPRWQIYSKDGLHRYHDINLLISGSIENPSGTSLLFTGGVFFWPGVKIGYERLLILLFSETLIMFRFILLLYYFREILYGLIF